jgi:HIRAN domain
VSNSGVGSTEPPDNTERLRLWLERDRRGAGYHLRDAATNEPVSWDDPRIRVVPVAGVSFRPEAVADASFDPGSRLRLVPEPTNEHDPNAVAVWNGERTLQAGYVPREVAAELDGSEQAVSLWRAGEGLRVLIAPRDAWIGRPRR